jgi:hypothetical protein
MSHFKASKLAIVASLTMLGAATSPARADLLILASLGTLPFGPFTPTEDIVVTGSIVNVSNQDVTICEGICGGVNSTYELGGFAGAQTGLRAGTGEELHFRRVHSGWRAAPRRAYTTSARNYR